MNAADYSSRYAEQEKKIQSNRKALMDLAVELAERALASDTVRRVVEKATTGMREYRRVVVDTRIIRRIGAELGLSKTQEVELRDRLENGEPDHAG